MPMLASTPSYTASGTATATLLRSGSVTLHAVEAENINTTIVYVQLFNAAAATDVTLGSTAPDQTYMIPQGGGAAAPTSRLIDFSTPLGFDKGLVYAVTTARSGAVPPTSAVPLNFRIS